METQQQLNPVISGKIDDFYGKPGATTLHEVVESYLGGKTSQASGVSAGNGNESRAVYNQAHLAAPPQGGRIAADSYDRNGQVIDHFDPKGHADITVQDATRKATVQTYP